MPSTEVKTPPLDFVTLLARLTKKKRWVLLEQQDSGTGVDYWYEHGKTTAYINQDQNWLTVNVGGLEYFTGTDEEARHI
jgi:hypothetical protein